MVSQLLKNKGIEDQKFIVGINPNVSDPLKAWPVERFAQLADRIESKYDVQIVLTGGSQDIVSTFVAAQLMSTKPVNLAGELTLSQLAAFIERCNLFISCDTGPAHIGMAGGTPLVVLFGPTEPEVWGPLGKAAATVVRNEKLSCGPCYSKRCRTGSRECMKSIPVEEVFKAAAGYLENSKKVY